MTREVQFNFTEFQNWLDEHSEYEAIVDAANIGLYQQNFAEGGFSISQLVAVVKELYNRSKKWPLVVLHNKCFRTLFEDSSYRELFTNSSLRQIHMWNRELKQLQGIAFLKALGIDNILGFDWPASPSPEAMIRALEVLYSLGVIDDDAKLTSPTGFQIVEIPLDPMISKMILASNELGCSEEILTIAAIFSIQSIWVSSRGSQKELDEARMRFAAAEVHEGRRFHSRST